MRLRQAEKTESVGLGRQKSCMDQTVVVGAANIPDRVASLTNRPPADGAAALSLVPGRDLPAARLPHSPVQRGCLSWHRIGDFCAGQGYAWCGLGWWQIMKGNALGPG